MGWATRRQFANHPHLVPKANVTVYVKTLEAASRLFGASDAE